MISQQQEQQEQQERKHLYQTEKEKKKEKKKKKKKKVRGKRHTQKGACSTGDTSSIKTAFQKLGSSTNLFPNTIVIIQFL